MKRLGMALAALVLTVGMAVPAMGAGPGHDLPNMTGATVVATGASSDFSLAFTGHTGKAGDAHGSLDYVSGTTTITDLDLERLAYMDEETATSGGCTHGAMVIARGTALLNGVEQVRVWIDLQDREEGDRARIRARAQDDHHEHDVAMLADGHDDGHDDGCSHDDSTWLVRSGWFDVRDVWVRWKGYTQS